MRKLGLRAIYPKGIYPKGSLSKKHPEHKVYPYLLKDVAIIRPNQVWSADITYIRLRRRGFLYLGGDYGLVFPLCFGLALKQFPGDVFLPGSAGGGVIPGMPRDIQHRSLVWAP